MVNVERAPEALRDVKGGRKIVALPDLTVFPAESPMLINCTI